MPSLIDSVFAYKFIKLLSKPFTEWKAYKMGLIDENGEVIKQPKTVKEKAVWNKFAILVRNLKRLIERTPLGRFKISSILVALKLLKEETGEDFYPILVETYPELDCLDDYHPPMNESIKYWHDEQSSYKIINTLDEYHGFPVYEAIDLLTGTRTIIIPVE